MALAHNSPQVYGSLFKREPNEAVRKYYRLLWIAFYILIFVFKDFLPEKFSRDANLLAEMVESGSKDEGAFGAMALIYSYVPAAILPLLPMVLCVPTLWIIMGNIRSYIVMMIMPIIMMPFLVMNFMYPSKETLVALMAMGVYHVSRSKLSTFRAFMLIVLMYCVYAAGVRIYYFLITAFFASIVIGRRLPLPIVVGGILCVLTLGALFLPAEVYEEIQGPRDMASWTMTRLTNEVRTMFFNPLPPDSMPNFLVNMTFGLLVMFFPFIIAQSFNEVLMMVNVFFYSGLVLAIIRHKRGAAQLPAFLFMGHILTQAQFEPDLGSYVRHFSSVLLILAPGLPYLFATKPKDTTPQDEQVAEQTDQTTPSPATSAATLR